MKQVTHEDWLFIGVPKESDDITVNIDQDSRQQFYLQYDSDKFKGLQNYESIKLPSGPWKFHSVSDNMTPDKLKEMGFNSIDEFDNHLKSLGFHFENPLGKRPDYYKSVNWGHQKTDALLNWEKAQSSVVGKIINLRKI